MASFQEVQSISRQETWEMTSGSPHAIADGSIVSGIKEDSCTATLIKWQTDVDDAVSWVISTSDGSVVVVSTIEQRLSILRGCDGAVLVTRNIAPKLNESEILLLEQNISFVDNSACSNINDVLVVPYLSNGEKDQPRSISILMVCGIDGQSFNTECNESKREALMQMSTKHFDIELPITLNGISSLKPCFINQNVIRFMINGNDNTIAMYDYDFSPQNDTSRQTCHTFTLQEQLHCDYVFDELWTVDINVEPQFDIKGSNIFLILIVNSNLGRSKVCWVDYLSLEIRCQYELVDSDKSTISKIKSIKALVSPQNSVAVAIATLTNMNKDCEVSVIQGGITKMGEDATSVIIIYPQEVFNIPIITKGIISEDMSSFELAIFPRKEVYSFIFRLDTSHTTKYCGFEAREHMNIGYLKLLLSSGKFDEASTMLNGFANNELICEFGYAHDSEIALWRLIHMLKKNVLLSKDKKDKLREIFRHLATGAVSGGDHGSQSLIYASRSLRQWPSSCSTTSKGPQIRDFRMVMSAMLINIQNALQGVPFNHVAALENEIKSLKAKVDCLKCLEEILKIGKEEVLLGRQLGSLENIFQLFLFLIRIRAFNFAEKVRKYDNERSIGPKEVQSAVLLLPFQCDPREFCGWFEEAIVPYLAFSQTRLSTLKQWCCDAADYYDSDDNFGMEDSILLLSSFSSALSSASSDKHLLFTTHFSTLKQERDSVRIKDSYPPSIVDTKLSHAIMLKEARAMGLSSYMVSLGSFVAKGGATFVAKNLVGITCEATSVEKFCKSSSKDDIVVFCEKWSICFEEAVAAYAEELCDPTMKTYNLLKSVGLFNLCSDPSKKCFIALKVLRAAQLSNQKIENFKKFSSDAIALATDESSKSELEEVSRLLVIDDIVRRYCGSKAAELFRVADPLHSSRLLSHICRFIHEPNQLEDIIFLCQSFTHLSLGDACSQILERIVTLERSSENKSEESQYSKYEKCQNIVEIFLKVDITVIINVGLRLCKFCSSIIKKIRDRAAIDTKNKKEHVAKYLDCCSVINVIESTISKYLRERNHQVGFSMTDFVHIQSYSSSFSRLRALIVNFGVFLSIEDLGRTRCSPVFSTTIIRSSLNGWMNSDDNLNLKLFLDRARDGVFMLCGDNKSIREYEWWRALVSVSSSLVNEGKEEMGFQLIDSSGILNETQNDCAYHAILTSVMILCAQSVRSVSSTNEVSIPSMRRVLIAGSLLQDHLLTLCSDTLLPSVVFFNNTIDIVSQVFLHTDCGVGEEMESFRLSLYKKSQARKPLSLLRNNIYQSEEETNEVMKLAVLHPSWYIGDGLLLPPSETMVHCMNLFRELMIHSNLLDDSPVSSRIYSLYEFLLSRGSLSSSLRIFSHAFAITSSSSVVNENQDKKSSINLATIGSEMSYRLAERSLGNSGSGNTSGRIDSELAVFYLLTLPMKVAFEVYKRCLPSAMSRREFDRIITLSNIGLRTAGMQSNYDKNMPRHYCWTKNQSIFISQCQKLLAKAFFWKILNHFDISFDPTYFETSHEGNSTESIAYIRNILISLIRHAAKGMANPNCITRLAIDFAQSFSFDKNLAIQCHIEFLLSPENDSINTKSNSIPNSTSIYDNVKSTVRNLLCLLPTHTERSGVLKKGLISLENKDFGKDFERYFLVLSLYQTELYEIVQDKVSATNKSWYMEEIHRIGRRIDALAIISSYFEGKPFEQRPPVEKCFIPLTSQKNSVTFCGVLGNINGQGNISTTNMFDPLAPITLYLKDENAVSALAPLCAPLGLPSGFIHARALILRFEAAKTLGYVLPNFETKVITTIKRLRVSKDGATLSEWCANTYENNSTERLQCLDLAHTFAIRSSNEAEMQRRRNSVNHDDLYATQEREALDQLKRITDAKSILEDEVLVTNCLEKYLNERATSQSVLKILSRVIENVRKVKKIDPTPEIFVESLLIESSLIVAEATLDSMQGVADDDFFHFSLSIYQACKLLEDRYSHIDVDSTAKCLAQQWLIHGDDSTKRVMMESVIHATRGYHSEISKAHDSHDSFDEDETEEFVLDLKSITASHGSWAGEGDKSSKKRDVTADEEISCLRPAQNGRETSEYTSARAALRVSFILHGQNQDSNKTKHAKHLLKIVFAKSSLMIEGGLKSISPNIFYNHQTPTSFEGATKDKVDGKALTFAMRYRALRAAVLLYDENILKTIIEEEEYYDMNNCTISKCCFGSLLAKEIESMQLSLPHSDLEQLSVMHHPSYARTLWKHFNHKNYNGYKGRYLLLLLELSTRDKVNLLDKSLVKTILSEIMKEELPRTILLSCECLAALKDIELIFENDRDFEKIVVKLCTRFMISLLKEIDMSEASLQLGSIIPTLQRFGKTVMIFLQNGIDSEEIMLLVEKLCQIGESIEKDDAIVRAIYDIICSISLRLNKEMRFKVISFIKSSQSGREAISRKIGVDNWLPNINVSSQEWPDCLSKVVTYETNRNALSGSEESAGTADVL